MSEIGEKGQQKIIDSKVLCVGTGGLGYIILQYIVCAGVGTIGVVDEDIAEYAEII